MNESERFWQHIDRLVAGAEVIIDRPAGTAHPRYPDFIYPLDYGYLQGTSAGDGGGIDVWRGSLPGAVASGGICTVDLTKHDSEIKILLGCTAGEMQVALRTHNGGSMAGVLIERGRD
ncbi:MAG: inorganic pyrophosphatase [Actinobacteria bacterium]|nr:MAG: inorganic pyrophosphatase [Actinomycetota bacterium]